jgi:8-oxo-dGTP pyrophosphatase MutT (NUDIX family)
MKTRASFVGLIYQNSICLGKRISEHNGETVPYGNYWSLFGGSIEKGEAPYYAAYRELLEETSIDIRLDKIKYCNTIRDENETLHIYFSELDELINPTLNFEHAEFGWFNIDDLDNFPYLLDIKILNSIKKYQKNRFIL